MSTLWITWWALCNEQERSHGEEKNMDTEKGLMRPQTKGHPRLEPQEPQGAKENPPREPLEGAQPG